MSAAQVTEDRSELRRVVRNVLDDACRHGAGTVTVELGERGSHVELAVTDEGPGIPLERSAEVFERFTRLDEGRTGTADGSGLGLAIVREIV